MACTTGIFFTPVVQSSIWDNPGLAQNFTSKLNAYKANSYWFFLNDWIFPRPQDPKKLPEGTLSEPWALVNISTLRWGFPGERAFITIITIIIVIIIIIIIIIIIFSQLNN